ncbi:hypothetical protein GCM10020227_29380 [Streptomyces flavovirens]
MLRDAEAKPAKEVAQSLDAWEAAHRSRIDQFLGQGGFVE